MHINFNSIHWPPNISELNWCAIGMVIALLIIATIPNEKTYKRFALISAGVVLILILILTGSTVGG